MKLTHIKIEAVKKLDLLNYNTKQVFYRIIDQFDVNYFTLDQLVDIAQGYIEYNNKMLDELTFNKFIIYVADIGKYRLNLDNFYQ